MHTEGAGAAHCREPGGLAGCLVWVGGWRLAVAGGGTTLLNPLSLPRGKQDVVAGDGTTSVTVLCGALLKKSLELLEKGETSWRRLLCHPLHG